MGYLGNKPADSYLTLEKQTFTTSATDTYNLNREVSGVNDIELFLNNVRQEPTEAYTISGTTLTLASAITASDSMYCIYQGRSVGTQTPATGSVTNAMLAGSIANSKLAGGIESSKLAFASYPYRNLIINGDMSIAQRGTSVSSITTSGYRTMDRWNFATDLGTWTMSQETDVPTGQGFAKSLKLDCTTANASPSAGNFLVLEQKIEGQNLQMLKKGTSNAESLTMSFWVKSSKTGTYICELLDTDNSRQISKSYTINSANTWEKKTLTYDGDTTGAFNNDNAESLRIDFWLGAGSTFTGGTLSTTWTATSNGDRVAGSVNLADSTSNNWYITGVQLEVGTSASDFEFLPHDINLQRCLRYTQKHPQKSDGGAYKVIAQGMADGGTLALCNINPLPVEMRATASLSSSGSFRAHRPTGASSVSSIAINSDHVGSTTFAIRVNTSSLTTGHSIFLEQNNDIDAHVLLDSEL